MTETLVTTAEEQLAEVLDWLRAGERTAGEVADEIRRRLDRVGRTHDGWRSRCLVAEKKNREFIAELQAVREELRDLRYGTTEEPAIAR